MIPPNTKSIMAGAYYNKGLQHITLPKGIESIGESAFCYNELESVVIPGTVRVIEESAFSFNKLTKAFIAPGVERIAPRAFVYNKITAIVIPDSVREIGGSAFGVNPITYIRIGADVDIHTESFPNGFAAYYDLQNKCAGVYIFQDDAWTVRLRRKDVYQKDVQILYLSHGAAAVEDLLRKDKVKILTVRRALDGLKENGVEAAPLEELLRKMYVRGPPTPVSGTARTYRVQQTARTLPFIRIPLNVLGVGKSDEVTVRFEDGVITITKRR